MSATPAAGSASPVGHLTWEETVIWLRTRPEHTALVHGCYLDDPLLDAARRFAGSDEWRAVRRLLPHRPGVALDLGAGRGIASFALAEDGWRVVAIEPDASPIVGAGAVRRLATEAAIAVDVLEDRGESLSLGDASVDVVYGRQVLHHACDLRAMCRELARVLRPGGRLVICREHVISRQADLPEFLANHPLAAYFGGEHAYLLEDYIAAIESAGLRVTRTIGPFDSVINSFPMTAAELQAEALREMSRYLHPRASRVLMSGRSPIAPVLQRLSLAHRSRTCDTPGRLFAFTAERALR